MFDVAADMVRMCPALSKRVKILASQKRIIYQPTNSFYQVLSAEAYSKHGFNIHGVVFDELYTQPNRKLFDVMTKGSGDARMQPLYFLITTAGTDTNSICYETHQKAKDILEGRKIDPTFYPVIYGADETEDWTDPKVWKKANPSLGMQNTGNTKLGLTDAEYTSQVDAGTYTNFIKDGYGYGLAQWTYYSRKQSLLDYMTAAGVSIGNGFLLFCAAYLLFWKQS